MNIPISNTLFCDFLNCPYKAHLTLMGHSVPQSDFELMLDRQLNDYRRIANDHLLRSVRTSEACQKPRSLLNAIKHGHTVITDADTAVQDMECHFDALLRINIDSSTPEYIPILYVPAEKISTQDKLLLAFLASILSEVQGTIVHFGKIIYGSTLTTSKVQLRTLLPRVQQSVKEIADLRSSTTPPRLRLNAYCKMCPFKDQCRSDAVEKDDLTLMQGLPSKKVVELNAKGIFTVTQFSFTFRQRKKPKGMGQIVPKHNYALQARAIRENALYIAEKPVLPCRDTQVYFDIEGIPDSAFYYLIGLLVVKSGSHDFHSFWADSKDQQEQNWTSFLAVLNQIDEFDLLHYGKYDRQFLRRMRQRYGGNADLLDKIDSCCFDVLPAIHSHVYFPVLRNDLKSIASCLGFVWSSDGASGLDSIVWHDEWARSRSTSVKDRLIQYNKDDCLALQAVVTFLRALSADNLTADTIHFSKIAHSGDLQSELPHRFRKQQFFFPDLAHIHDCSIFEYQKHRVYLRSKTERWKSRTRAPSLTKTRPRVNKVVLHATPSVCDQCGSHNLKPRGDYRKDIVDLRFFSGGVKTWNERHKARCYKCKQCGHVLYPEEYLSLGGQRLGRSRSGENLDVWCVYNKIALSQSLRQIATGVYDLFGLSCHHTTVANAVRKVAQRYKSTYLDLIDKLRMSRVIHADETWVSLTASSKQRGYIWTFANMETAVYKFSLTRDAVTPKEMVEKFDGVLVSDFFRAYDSLKCIQQKCLIHLIRDMNDDLFRNPFDTELKRMVSAFGVLLRSIVETIDRYGLKRRYLNKHRRDVDRFYRAELAGNFTSTKAQRYQKRMRQYQEKLFVFLEHDGVPWNNNNAENAIKTFVVRRELFGPFAERRIEDYLILFSLYHTLRCRNASILDFLRSGETDIDRFCDTRRGVPSGAKTADHVTD